MGVSGQKREKSTSQDLEHDSDKALRKIIKKHVGR